MKSLNIATTGMLAQQTHIDVTSNNIANMTTTGYKRQKAEFQDLLYQNQKRVGTRSSDAGTIVPTGIQLGVGVKPGTINRITEQGSLERTENPLDLAINGGGYFMIEDPDGEILYTRDGTFKTSPEGEIVTTDGFLVQPGFNIPDDAVDVIISADGIVEVKLQDQVEYVELGQLELTTFINPAGLEAIGQNLFKESVASGNPIVAAPGEDNLGVIMQGFLETSNVNPITEITTLITAQRSYEMNSRVISTSDEMLQTVGQISR